MGNLKELNDKIWKVMLDILSNISDNVYIQILIVLVFVSLFWLGLNYFIQNKFDRLLVPFGPISMAMCLSVGYMTERLPMIHARMHKALGISSSVIESSKTYLSAFEHVANITVNKSSDIVSYLYYLNETQRNAWECNPIELYESLFRTFDKIRGGWILPDVHLSSFSTLSIPFVLCIITILLNSIILLGKNPDKVRILFYIIQSIFLIYTTKISNGAFIFAMLLWLIEELFIGILNTNV